MPFTSNRGLQHHGLWCYGRWKTDDASAIQKAINTCSEAGGGTVLVPSGHTFLCGPFKLASYVELQLAPNSRLLANPDESIYTESAFGANRGEGMMWISGKDLKMYQSPELEALTETELHSWERNWKILMS